MKLSLRLIASLVVSISLVTVIVANMQVRTAKDGLRTDLARRAEILTDSLQEAIEPLLQRSQATQLERMVERFNGREHLAGIAVYDANGNVIAASAKIRATAATPPDVFTKAMTADEGIGEFQNIGQSKLYVYASPLHRGVDVSGAVVTFHDASFINVQSVQIWRNALWHVIVQVLLIVLITYLLLRWTVVGPIKKISQWMKDVRAGKTAVPPPAGAQAEFLQPLATEATQLGQNLAEARLAAKQEAHLRDTADSRWTAERLRVAVHKLLHGSSLYVISNREPYEHIHRGKDIQVRVPASGLVTALEPILKACEGTWIAQGAADGDRETVDEHDHLRVPPDQPHYTLRRVWVTPEEEEGFYYGFANEGIWPLCHIAHTRPTFRSTDWASYKEVNEKFAQATLEEIKNEEAPFVLIQDYHFALLPRMIKTARPDARVAIFWHIPWPNPEAFGICPWQKELLDGLLGADLISFHIQAHCNNFLETVDNAIESRIEWDRFAVNRNQHYTIVRPHPISVALPEMDGGSPNVHALMKTRAEILDETGKETLFLGVGVDRVDYTKGLIERFRGIERFFEKYPHFIKQFTFIQFGAPSRTNIKRYQDLLDKVAAEAQRINERFHANGWKAIIFHGQHHSHAEIEPYYRAADLCMVTSLHDGMNLVAKEYVATRGDEDGVLILSQFTGASRELHDALSVNPYDTEQLADTIRRALEMAPEERHMRMQQMRRTVKEHNVYRWAAELITELAEVRLNTPELAESR